MSTNLLLDVEPVTYRELVVDLPDGIFVRWSFDALVIGDSDVEDTRKRLYVDGVNHVLLCDRCGNTLWLAEATDHWIRHETADFVGEAAFEHFGLQGSLVHFGRAFRAAEWGSLYDTVTGLLFDSSYLNRRGDDQTANRCRFCAVTT